MVNISTNIKKYHLLPELVEHKNDNNVDIGNRGPCFVQALRCDGVKSIDWIPVLVLNNFVSNANTDKH